MFNQVRQSVHPKFKKIHHQFTIIVNTRLMFSSTNCKKKLHLTAQHYTATVNNIMYNVSLSTAISIHCRKYITDRTYTDNFRTSKELATTLTFYPNTLQHYRLTYRHTSTTNITLLTHCMVYAICKLILQTQMLNIYVMVNQL